MATATLEKIVSPESPRLLESGVSFDEFIEAPRFQGRHVEWVSGEVWEKMSTSEVHSSLVAFLVTLLRLVADRQRAGRVFTDQYLMRLEDQERGREPDVVFVATAHLARIRGNHLEGPADIAIEIVSPGSESVDRGDKFLEYETGGVQEYWLIDPQRQYAEFFLRDEDGLFRPARLENGVFQSQVLPTVRLRIEWLWQEPDVWDVLREWNLL